MRKKITRNLLKCILVIGLICVSLGMQAQWTISGSQLYPSLSSTRVIVGQTGSFATNTKFHVSENACDAQYRNYIRLSKNNGTANVVEENGQLYYTYGHPMSPSYGSVPINFIEEAPMYSQPGEPCLGWTDWDIDINSSTQSLVFRNYTNINSGPGAGTWHKDVMQINRNNSFINVPLTVPNLYSNDGRIVNFLTENITSSNNTTNTIVMNSNLEIKGNNTGSNGDTEIKLYKDGIIRAREIKVDYQLIPDYVFKPDYKLMSLPELEKYIATHKHLPNIKGESEFNETEGISLGEMNMKLLEKVEEQTLYIIELNKKLEALQAQVNKIKIN